MQPTPRKKHRPLCPEPTKWMDLVGSKCVSLLAEKFQIRLNAALVQFLEHYSDRVEHASHAQLLTSFTRVKTELRDFRDSLRPSERAQKHCFDVHVDARTVLPTVVCSLADLPLLYMRVVRNYGEKRSGVEFWLDSEGDVGAKAAQAEREMEAEALEKAGEVSVPDVLEMWFRKGMEILVCGQEEEDGAAGAASLESAGGASKGRLEKTKYAADDKRPRGAKRKPPGNGQPTKKTTGIDTQRKRKLPERSVGDATKVVSAKKARRSLVGGKRLSSPPTKNTIAGNSRNKKGLKAGPANDKATNVPPAGKAAVNGKSRDAQRVSLSPREITITHEPLESERMEEDASNNPSNRNARSPSPLRLIGNRSPMTPSVSRRGGSLGTQEAHGAIKRSSFAPVIAQPTAVSKSTVDQPSKIVRDGGTATSLDRANVEVSGGDGANVGDGVAALAPQQTALLPSSHRSRDVSRGPLEEHISPRKPADAGVLQTPTVIVQEVDGCNVISPNAREQSGEGHAQNSRSLPQAWQPEIPLVSQVPETLHSREPYPNSPLCSISLHESAPTGGLGRQVLSTEAACLQNAGDYGHHFQDPRTHAQPTSAYEGETLAKDSGRWMRRPATKPLPRDTEILGTRRGTRELFSRRAPRSASHCRDAEGIGAKVRRPKFSCGVASPPPNECHGVTTGDDDVTFSFTAFGLPESHADENGAGLCTF